MHSRLLLLLTALVMVGACQDWAEPLEARSESDLTRFGVAPGKETVRVIVRLKSLADREAVVEEARGLGATLKRRYDGFPSVALEVNENALRGLLRSPRVAEVTQDRLTRPTLDSSLPVINAAPVHAAGFDGSGSVIVILDSGIDRNHPFVAGRVLHEACFSSGGSDYYARGRDRGRSG